MSNLSVMNTHSDRSVDYKDAVKLFMSFTQGEVKIEILFLNSYTIIVK